MITQSLQKAVTAFPSKAMFCRAIGMKVQFLRQIERGDRPIPPRYALAVQELTNGAVTVHDLRPDIFGPAPREAA